MALDPDSLAGCKNACDGMGLSFAAFHPDDQECSCGPQLDFYTDCYRGSTTIYQKDECSLGDVRAVIKAAATDDAIPSSDLAAVVSSTEVNALVSSTAPIPTTEDATPPPAISTAAIATAPPRSADPCVVYRGDWPRTGQISRNIDPEECLKVRCAGYPMAAVDFGDTCRCGKFISERITMDLDSL
ncbi:hypothetical protein HK101_005425 [Irineochytrium annulatum]|nr:hypothetical protein HK101_005425 [Irineochytrium annulatum]